MDFAPPFETATLIKRYKRFLADIRLVDGTELTVHCPNTGSMKHCSEPGSQVLFSDSGNEQRKYRHTFEAVTTPSGAWAGINTGRANRLVEEAIEQGIIDSLQGYGNIRREVRYGLEKSRIDLLLENHPREADCYLEVKNVTLEEDGQRVLFPDAVTERGTKHLRELMAMRAEGFRAALCFCIQHNTAAYFSPAEKIDPVYTQTLREAIKVGVEVMAYGAEINSERIYLNRQIECVIN